MEYNSNIGSSTSTTSSGQPSTNNVTVVNSGPSNNSNGPVTATGVPHFTVNPSASDVQGEMLQYFEPSEARIESMSHLAMGPLGSRMMGVHYPYGMSANPRSMDPLSLSSGGLPVLPYPNQYPSNLLMSKGPYMMPHHVPYPIGLFPNPMNFNNASYTSPPTTTTAQPAPSPASAAASNALLTNTNLKTPQIIYRNLFHTMHCKFQNDTGEWEGCRVYINDNVGYSGNAKRFKKKPEKGEKALLLECAILTSNDQPAAQCLSCRDYFETQKYYKANPDCIGRIVLVKNNSPIRVENGQFKILIKMMCCCVHHTVDFFTFQLNLLDGDVDKAPRVVFSAKIPLSVKQWRKSNQKKEECVMILETKS